MPRPERQRAAGLLSRDAEDPPAGVAALRSWDAELRPPML